MAAAGRRGFAVVWLDERLVDALGILLTPAWVDWFGSFGLRARAQAARPRLGRLRQMPRRVSPKPRGAMVHLVRTRDWEGMNTGMNAKSARKNAQERAERAERRRRRTGSDGGGDCGVTALFLE